MKRAVRTYVTGAVLLATALVVSGGCGVYTFNPRGTSSIKTIAVQRFENRTDQFGLTDRLTEIVIDAFIADGNMKVVSADAADAVLAATLTGYRRAPFQFDENDNVQTYKVILDFDVALIKPSDQSEIWRASLPQEGIYAADTEAEEDGQQRAGQRLVEAIINRTTKSW